MIKIKKGNYGANKTWIKSLKSYVYFCKACGEYITKDNTCSNPFCPERIKDEISCNK